jgi:outer membrane protein OmpA-like peptidoglycan-associated protein
MKSAFIYLLGCSISLASLDLFAQIDESGNSYYVVIGVYAQEKNAKTFMHWAKAAGLNPKCEKNETKQYYYVYTMQENNWGMPVQEAERIRKAFPKLDDTWVYHGLLKDSIQNSETVAQAAQENPPIEGEIAALPVDNKKKFIFQLKAEDGKVINAPIEIVDLDSSKLHSVYPSNEIINLRAVNSSGRLMIQSKVFGYRLKQVAIDFNNPTDSAGITLDNGNYIVPLELKPLQEGDITIMYNVFFFKDASVMRPDSKYEVNALLAMMNEYPSRKIIMHGHTNGNWHGKMLILGEKKDFFSIDDCVTSKGSALELSRLRAHTIVDYLIANGISSDRMTVKPWGGKRPLFHHAHDRAIDNVRVEVEIARSDSKLQAARQNAPQK